MWPTFKEREEVQGGERENRRRCEEKKGREKRGGEGRIWVKKGKGGEEVELPPYVPLNFR